MDKKITKFGETEIEKRRFYHRKNISLSQHINTENIQVPSIGFLVKKVTNILLFKKMMMMIVNLNSYALHFQTQAPI